MGNEAAINNVINVSPTFYSTISVNDYMNYILDQKYHPIIEFLKQNSHSTLDEIHSHYADFYSLGDKEIEREKKSEITIYRYITQLIEHGIVIKSGRRINPKYVSSKILYSLKSDVFLFDIAQDLWISTRGITLAKTIGLILNRHFNNAKPLESKVLSFIENLHQNISLLQKNLFQKVLESKNKNKAHELILSVDLHSYINFLNLLGELIWLIDNKDHLGADFKGLLKELFRENGELSTKSTKINEKNLESEKKYQDLITFTPTLIKVFDSDIWESQKHPKYIAITAILRKRPMTLKEIHLRHFNYMKKVIEEYFPNKKEFYLHSLSELKENTVYRYIQSLMELGFVTEAGRRVFLDQTATNILYSRTAKMFHFSGFKRVFFETKQGRVFSKAVGVIIMVYLDKKKFNEQKFHSLLVKYLERKNKDYENALLLTSDEWVINPFFNFNKEENTVLIRILPLLEWILNSKTPSMELDKFLECFT